MWGHVVRTFLCMEYEDIHLPLAGVFTDGKTFDRLSCQGNAIIISFRHCLPVRRFSVNGAWACLRVRPLVSYAAAAWFLVCVQAHVPRLGRPIEHVSCYLTRTLNRKPFFSSSTFQDQSVAEPVVVYAWACVRDIHNRWSLKILYSRRNFYCQNRFILGYGCSFGFMIIHW